MVLRKTGKTKQTVEDRLSKRVVLYYLHVIHMCVCVHCSVITNGLISMMLGAAGNAIVIVT